MTLVNLMSGVLVAVTAAHEEGAGIVVGLGAGISVHWSWVNFWYIYPRVGPLRTSGCLVEGASIVVQVLMLGSAWCWN